MVRHRLSNDLSLTKYIRSILVSVPVGK